MALSLCHVKLYIDLTSSETDCKQRRTVQRVDTRYNANGARECPQRIALLTEFGVASAISHSGTK